MTDLVNSARYMVNNPSAWDSFDQRASDVIEAQQAYIERLRDALRDITDGYGPNHLSRFARDKARAALAKLDQPNDPN